ncbi:MAG: phosphoglucosamine mutase [Euryarchaeota archaeon]|nr:phosphoglucosamine mutase [Euryarchaeota archaeon]
MPRLFGTNGVRGIVGESMTPELALDLGRALGTWLHERCPWDHHGERPGVVIGTDFRTSAHALSSAVAAGLLSTGCDVLDVGQAPTPAIQFETKHREQVAVGVIVTASHNPPEWNGIKFCRGDGREMEPDHEEDIEEILFSRSFYAAAWDDQGSPMTVSGCVRRYHEGVKAQVDVEAIRARGFTVAVDTANGAGSVSLPFLLRELGCRVFTLNAQPDGTFPGHPSEPVPENAVDLMSMVERRRCDLGVLVDGDADRAIFIDEKGQYVWGDQSLALVAAEIVRRHDGGVVCTPVSSSSCVEEMVGSAGGKVQYTIVGSPKVARAMVDVQAVFGGEENGGLIYPPHQYSRDAGMAAALMLDILAKTDRPLSALVSEVPKKSVVKLKTHVDDTQKGYLLAAFKDKLESDGAPTGYTIREVDARDGVKAYLKEGWVLVRPSGTEPIMRVYAESGDEAVSKKMAETFLRFLESLQTEVKPAAGAAGRKA